MIYPNPKKIYAGDTPVQGVYLGSSLIWGWRSRIAKNFVEFNLDNGYTLGYTADSIDRYCSAISDILEKEDLEYFLSHNPQFGTVNLIDPEKYRGTAYGGLTWRPTDVLGNAVNGYIDTNFNPSLLVSEQKYQLDDASRGAVIYQEYSSNILNNGRFDGVGGTVTNHMVNGNVSYQRINQGDQSLSKNLDLSGTGLKSLIRDGDNVISVNKDQTDSATQPANSIANSTQKILWAQNYSNVGLSMYFMGASLTYDQTQRKRTAFNQLLIENNLTPIA